MAFLSYTKKASISLPCEASLPYEILTDYDTYNEWMPHVTQSKLLAKEGDLAIAEFEVIRPRSGKYALECIHTRNKMVLTRTISGKIPVSQFEWIIQADAEKKCRVTLTIQGKANWHRLVPAYRSFMDASKCLDALRSQVSALSPDLAIPDQGGEKIIELIESEQGLVCWIRGKKYLLTPAPEGK
jgi:ribosome-associated toxin RatA of RatAB toxin-antitoxin module